MDALQLYSGSGLTPFAFFKEKFFTFINNDLTIRSNFDLKPLQGTWCRPLEINALHGEPTAMTGTFILILSF